MAKKNYGPAPASQKKISEKISKVSHENPNLTRKQVLGKAFGILRWKAKKRGKLGK